MKILSGLIMLGSVLSLFANVDPFESDWDEYEAAIRKSKVRTATNVLARIEARAAAEKAWPDLAAARLRRTRLEYGITEENALDAEGKFGFVAQYAAQVESAPVEIRPMLRLALAHDYLQMRWSTMWRRDRTQLADAEGQPPWSEERLVPTLRALFASLAAERDALLAQKTRDWHRLVNPGDPFAQQCRPTLWDFAVHDAADLVGQMEDWGDPELEATVSAWLDGLAKTHTLENAPDAHVHALYERLRLADDDAPLALSNRLAFAERWRSVSAVSALAAHDVALRHAFADAPEKRLAAHRLAERFHARWPESPGGRNCLDLMKQMEQSDFTLRVENQLLARGETVAVSARNLTNLCFRLVSVSSREASDDGLMRALRGYGTGENEERLRKILRRKPTAAWSFALVDKGDYMDQKAECPFPEDVAPGYYILFAASNDAFGADGLPCRGAAVSRTDLHLMFANAANGWTGYVHDALAGTPRAGASIELWQWRDRRRVLCAQTKSGDDGSWQLPLPKGDKSGFIRATQGKQGTMWTSVNGWRETPSVSTADHVALVTDRAVYRPGQTVQFKGYAFHADPEQRDFHVIANRRVFVEFLDANRKQISELALVANDFGTFSGSFVAPRDRLTGRYELTARLRAAASGNVVATGAATVNVEEYKRPKFEAKLEKTEGMKLGVETKLTGVATTYTGLPVPGAKVRWTVRRETWHPFWWFWWHDRCGDDDEREVASGETVTDKKGGFAFAFVPTKPEKDKGEAESKYHFSCRAEVTDDAGETHEAETSFTVGTVPWEIGLVAKNAAWQTASVGTDWKLTLRTPDDKPVADVAAEVKAYALRQPERPLRKKLWGGPWDRFGDLGRARPKDPTDPRSWENGVPAGTLRVKTDAQGAAEGSFALAAGVYRLEGAATTAEGQTVRALAFVRVIDPAAKTYAVKEPFFHGLEKSTVRVGGTLRLFLATGYESGFFRVRVTQGEEVLAEAVREATNGVFEFPVTEKHRGTISVETVFVRENRLYAARDSVYVPWDNLELKVTREHWTSRLLPDARETWRFRISGADTNDVRRGVEALAVMYDKSLDAILNHSVYLPFSGHFSRGARGRWWYQVNQAASFDRWQGEWPRTPGHVTVSWPEWMPGALGVFVSRAWHRDVAMMCCKSRRAPLLGCAAAGCEAAPAAMADDGFALGGRVGAKAAVREEGKSGATNAAKASQTVPRKNLQETAFFLPTLVSDENGIVEFSFDVPQALTGWKFSLLAHDKHLASGRFENDEIVTVKPLMVEPNGPRFVREGDVFRFPVKVTNTDDRPQRGKVTLEFFDAESGRSVVLGTGAQAFALEPGETKTVEFELAIPEGCGYLRYVARAAGAEFADGEEGFLPVLSRRVMVQESLPMQIRKAGERAYAFLPLKASDRSDSLRHVGLAAQVVSDPTWYAFLALPYLMEYPHECNEQVFSRYYANALAAKIANADPAYREMFLAWEQADANAVKSPLELNEDLKQAMLDATPWVRAAADETKAKRHLGELFGSARLEAEQARAIEKLCANVAHDGLWPWFPGGDGSPWITLHILTGFARLRALGIEPKDMDRTLAKARQALDGRMEESLADRLKDRDKVKAFHLASEDLRWLYLQSFDKSWSKKYGSLLREHLEKEWTDFDIAGQSLAAIVLLRHGNAPLAREVVASLKERAVRSEEKGLYWKRLPFFDCSLYGAPVSAQALAMEAFLAVDPGDAEAYEEARLWLLEQKRTQNWSTTVSTADAVYAILLGRGQTAPAKVGPVTMTLGGAPVARENVEAGTGFYECRYAAEDVKAAMGDIVLSRKEDALGWASVTWTYLEDAAKVKAFEQKDLRLTKTYYKKTKVAGKTRLVALGGGERLEPGDELVARLAIDSDSILEYVHLRDERPASAEPVDVISSYRWQDGLGYYQSTRDTATHYYFDRLPRGNFVLETSFRVRQKGTFSSGLATLECMYAPEFGAHSAASVIRVGQ